MSLQGQLQSALEGLACAAQRLDAAAEIIAGRQKETAELREKCEKLREALNKAEAEREATQNSEAELSELKVEKEELVAVRNRLVAEKNQLLNEREQFKKFREGWGRERPALIKAKTDAEQELQRLKEQSGAAAQNDGRLDALKAENEKLRAELAEAEERKKKLADEKEGLSIELDGVRQAYGELKQTTQEASERLDSTLEELKILRG
ncbi:MAG: hypothetical protein IKR09_08450 [Alphaproteobacteria bacterium]|nr:hypothetical protein [Alphaproteobacteria bacterium]